MAAYNIQGNLAIKERNTRKVTVRKRKVVTRKIAIIPTQEKLLYLFTIFVCVLVAGTIIWRYAQIYEVNTKIQKMEQEINVLHEENETLKLEVYKLQDPKRLIEVGKILGLQEPGEKDINEITATTHKGNPTNEVVYTE